MTTEQSYKIGTPGQPWGNAEKSAWFQAQTVKRSYQSQVVSKIKSIHKYLPELLDLKRYGALSYDSEAYELWLFRSKQWQQDKPTILVTGGVHGYETSGVFGALRFVETELVKYSDHFNFIVAPCISPWGYETINRWNPNAVDPNRSFYKDGPAEESKNIMDYVLGLNIELLAHIDLHETTDTDNSEFRPALAARDAIPQKSWNIPDGFYGVGDSLKPQPEFQKAIIDSVSKVTHIAPADESNKLIGSDLAQFGVINYPTKELGLCAGFTDAEYVSTTEVYPDSPKSDAENCIIAQVAAVTGGLNYLVGKK
jgi:hypothetical protein